MTTKSATVINTRYLSSESKMARIRQIDNGIFTVETATDRGVWTTDTYTQEGFTFDMESAHMAVEMLLNDDRAGFALLNYWYDDGSEDYKESECKVFKNDDGSWDFSTPYHHYFARANRIQLTREQAMKAISLYYNDGDEYIKYTDTLAGL